MVDSGSLSDIVTAGAACAAAVLSGITVWVTGRRSETAWFRSALIDALEHYAQASFNRRRSARAVMEARRHGGSTTQEWQTLRAACRQTHMDQSDRLTRLRLLASDEVVAAAEDLSVADLMFEELVLSSREAPTNSDQWLWDKAREDNDLKKEQFIRCARRSMKIGGGVGIDSRMRPAITAKE